MGTYTSAKNIVTIHPAELACLRAIEQAAREYRAAWSRNDIRGDDYTIANRDARYKLFALLDDAPSP